MNTSAATAPRRVGLFGGSFDPPHRAHLALARCARDTLALDELRWLPAGQPWHKARRLTAPRHRLAMLEAAIVGEAGMAVERLEIDRDAPGYTVDTVDALARREPGRRWWLVIGQDQHAAFTGWHRWRDLLAQVRLAVASRPGVERPVPAEVLAAGHDVLPLPAMEISATAIRAAVAARADISQLVPPGVARYIEINGLYLSEPSPDHRS